MMAGERCSIQFRSHSKTGPISGLAASAGVWLLEHPGWVDSQVVFVVLAEVARPVEQLGAGLLHK